MLIAMQSDSSPVDHETVMLSLRGRGLRAHLISDSGDAAIAVSDATPDTLLDAEIGRMAGVRQVRRSSTPYLLAQRIARPAGTTVDVGGVRIGGDQPVVIAGPCVVESLDGL